MRIRFENEFAKQLFMEVSALRDVTAIGRRYFSQADAWELWQEVYKSDFGCTRYIVSDLWEDRNQNNNPDGHQDGK